LAWYEDVAFISGSGVGEPLGFIACPAMVQVAKETGQAAATILWENIVKMYARMLPASLGRAVWIASIDTFPELATMALSVGTGGSAIWLNNGQAGPPMTILGRPVIFTEKTSVLGTAGDINFVDLGYYLIGDRQAMQASSSEHYKFQNDKTVYRIIERLDGRPWLQSSITPKNGAGNLSPFVQIATDGGLLPHPVRRPTIPVFPFERVEAVVDFSEVPVGSQVIALVKEQGFMTWEHSVVLEYSDPNNLLRWRQRFAFHSGASGPQDNPAPVTSPDMPDAPELLGFFTATERTPGWWEVMRGRPDSNPTG